MDIHEWRRGLPRRGFLKFSVKAAAAASLGLAACDDDGGAARDGGLVGDRGVELDAGVDPDAARDAEADLGADAEADAEVDAAAPEVFPTPVVVGSMTATTALLRGQVTGLSAVTLRIWPVGDEGAAVESEVPAEEGYVKLELVDLEPGTHYAATLLGGEATAPTAHFNTCPAAGDLSPLTIAATACTKHTFKPYVSIEQAAQEDIDLFVFLGDMSYNDGAETLEDYRGRWTRTLQDPGYRAIYGKTGVYATWDDHEFDNNFEGDNLDPAIVQAAMDSYFEAIPVWHEGPRIWRSFRWGHTAEFFMLDCRLERRRETRETEDAQYISPAQFDWLTAALSESPCHFKVVCTSVPITAFPEVWPALPDRWQGYAAQRRRLLDHVAGENIGNVWFLAGDFHIGLVARVEPVDAERNYWEILPGPGGSVGNPVSLLVENPEFRAEWLPEDRFIHFNGSRASTTLTFDPAEDTVHVRYKDGETGELLYDAVLRDADV